MSKRRSQIAAPTTPTTARSVVVIGSYREDLPGLLTFTQRVAALGLRILHPPPLARAVGEESGFVRLTCDRSLDRGYVQRHVLSMIDQADAVIVYCPSGRIGVSAAMEIGYALRAQRRILATTAPEDLTLRALIGYEPAALGDYLRAAAGLEDGSEHAQRSNL